MSEFEQTTLANINIVRSLTNTLGGGLNKSLGQNFLINQNSLLKFVKSISLSKNDIVIEIGPGIGIVTYTLCQNAKKVYAIEIDKSKEAALQKSLENFNNYKIIWEDATQFNFSEFHEELKKEHGEVSTDLKLIGSLPYNSAKKIIYNILTSNLEWSEAAFFLQLEVAENYVSKAPTAEFLSNFVRIFADVDFAFGVPAEHFMPKPKVKTGVIHLKRHDKFNHLDKSAFASFIKHGFTQPRKTVLNNLKSLGFNLDDLKKLGIKETARPSELVIEEWEKMYVERLKS